MLNNYQANQCLIKFSVIHGACSNAKFHLKRKTASLPKSEIH